MPATSNYTHSVSFAIGDMLVEAPEQAWRLRLLEVMLLAGIPLYRLRLIDDLFSESKYR
jgi:hypothetical protein